MPQPVNGYTVPEGRDGYALTADLVRMALTGGQARIEGDAATLAQAVAHTDEQVRSVTGVDPATVRAVADLVSAVDLNDAQGARLINPASTETVLATNYATNPAGGSDGGWVSSSTPSYTVEWDTSVRRRPGSRSSRSTSLTASSVIGSWGWVGSAGNTGIPIPASAAGNSLPIGIWFRDGGLSSSSAYIRVAFLVGGSWQSFIITPTVDLPSATWAEVAASVTVPTGATAVRLYPMVTTRGGGTAPAGAQAWAADARIGTEDYFDGAMPNGQGRSTRWTGPAHASTSQAFIPPPSQTRAAGDDRWKRAALAPAFHQEAFIARRGGTIGTGGVGAVAIRWDHWPDHAPALIALHRKYGIPWTWAHYSQQRNPALARDTTGHDMTWSQIQAYALDSGAELWCHGRTHTDQATYQGRHDEIVLAKAELQAALPACAIEGFVIPGVGGSSWGGFNLTRTPDHWLGTDVGRLVLENYAVSTGHMGSRYRSLTGTIRQGLVHVTIENMSLSSVTPLLLNARNLRRGVCLMLHPDHIGNGGMSLADYEAVLAALAGHRAAGTLKVLTLGGLTLADTSHAFQDDLVTYGRFEGSGGGTAGWTTNGTWLINAPSSLTGLPSGQRVASSQITGDVIEQSLDLGNLADLAGGIRQLVFRVWNTNSSTQKCRVRINGSLIDREFDVPPSTTGPTTIHVPHMLDARGGTHTYGVGPTSGNRLYFSDIQMLAV